MRSRAVLPLVLLTLLAACATPFRAEVRRFQQLPAPEGQSVYIQASDRMKAGGLEFATYASLVRERLAAVGYRPAESPRGATLVVDLDYGVSDGRERIATRPGSGFGYGPGWGWGGWPYYSRYYRPYWGHGWGFYDPFWGGPFAEPEVYSYTVYDSFVAMRINRAATGESVFEGRAEAKTRSNDLPALVPNLVDALFTNFPGRSGETVKVSIDPRKRG
jgi:hypothetical protein